MSNEYEDWIVETRAENKALIAKYPFLYTGNGYDYTHLDDIPSGWRVAFGEQFCEDLLNALGEYVGRFEIVQLKEKYGQLRMHCATDHVPDEVCNRLEQVASKYLDISAKTCVICGASAIMRTNNAWMEPLCDNCYER